MRYNFLIVLCWLAEWHYSITSMIAEDAYSFLKKCFNLKARLAKHKNKQDIYL